MTIWKRERAHFNYYITNERKRPHIYVEALGTPSASTEKILNDHGFETNSYSLDYDFIELSKIEIIQVLEKKKKDLEKEKKEKQILKLQKCIFSYIEWAGTRKHPKAIEKESYGIIKGSWIYYKNGKKSLNGKYVHVIKEFERAPRGTAALFKQIEKDL